jgi:hypothetical protein
MAIKFILWPKHMIEDDILNAPPDQVLSIFRAYTVAMSRPAPSIVPGSEGFDAAVLCIKDMFSDAEARVEPIEPPALPSSTVTSRSLARLRLIDTGHASRVIACGMEVLMDFIHDPHNAAAKELMNALLANDEYVRNHMTAVVKALCAAWPALGLADRLGEILEKRPELIPLTADAVLSNLVEGLTTVRVEAREKLLALIANHAEVPQEYLQNFMLEACRPGKDPTRIVPAFSVLFQSRFWDNMMSDGRNSYFLNNIGDHLEKHRDYAAIKVFYEFFEARLRAAYTKNFSSPPLGATP